MTITEMETADQELTTTEVVRTTTETEITDQEVTTTSASAYAGTSAGAYISTDTRPRRIGSLPTS